MTFFGFGWELGDNDEQEGMKESDEMEVVNVVSTEKRVKLRDVTCLLREGVRSGDSDLDLTTGETCL